MNANARLAELVAAVQSCIVTTDNPFAAEKLHTRQLTIQAIEQLIGQYSIADIIEALTVEKLRLTEFTQNSGGMLAYEISLPYREALYNCEAATAFLQSIAVQHNSADNAGA